MIGLEPRKVIFYSWIITKFFLNSKREFDRFDKFLDFLNFDNTLFEYAEHIGDKANMLLSNVESSKICETRFEWAFVILEDSLMRDFEVFADDGRGGLFFHLKVQTTRNKSEC